MRTSVSRGCHRPSWWRALLLLAAGVGLSAAAETDLQRLQRLVGDLLALQQAAGDAEAGWGEQRPAVEGRIEVLRQQVALAEARQREAQQAAEVTAGGRQALESDVRRSRDALLALGAPLAQAEDVLRGLRPRLPEPLNRSLSERLRDLPASGTPVTADTLADRLRLVFGLLTEIDQFANGVYLFRQPLTDPQQVQREMDTLYLGLSMAFAVSADGTSAAAGTPAAGGWEWRWDPALAPSVRTAVAIYRKEQPASFVVLPLELVPTPAGGKP